MPPVTNVAMPTACANTMVDATVVAPQEGVMDDVNDDVNDGAVRMHNSLVEHFKAEDEELAKSCN